MDVLTIASVPAIVTVVAALIQFYKLFAKKEILMKIIPMLAGVLGVICGVVVFYLMPDIIPTDNLFVAMIIGGASGLAATGSNQILKQLTKEDKKDGEDDNTTDTP